MAAVLAPTTRRIALATGLSLTVNTWGTRDAAPILLLHGFLDSSRSWDRVAAHLAHDAYVVAPDLRGHGDSDWIGAGGYYHFFDYLADLDDLLPRLDPRPWAIVGHSMGGSVAAYFAATRPARCRALALIEGLGPPEGQAAGPARTAQWLDAWSRSRRPRRPMQDLQVAAARLRKHDARVSEEESVRLATLQARAVDGGFVWKADPLHMTQGPVPFRREVAAQF